MAVKLLDTYTQTPLIHNFVALRTCSTRLVVPILKSLISRAEKLSHIDICTSYCHTDHTEKREWLEKRHTVANLEVRPRMSSIYNNQ